MSADLGRRERMLSILAVWSLGFFILLIQAGYLQLVKGHHYLRLSEQNRLRMISIPAPRGLMLDCEGHLMVQSRPGFDLVLLPTDKWQKQLNRAAVLLGLDSLLLKSAVVFQRKLFPKDPVTLVKDLSPVQVARIEEHFEELPGMRLEVQSLRKAEYSELGSHLIGYTSAIGQKEYADFKEKGYGYGDYIGKGGLELQYEDLLRGRKGFDFLEVDAQGRDLGSFSPEDRIDPVPGNNLILSINWKLEQYTEGLFEPGMAGAAVAIEPATGRILALVSRPNFDPNLFAAGIRSEDWNRLVNDPSFPLWDRAIRSSYPPGSTFKLLTAAAAMEESLAGPQTRMRTACHGAILIGNRIFKCWKKGGHGSLTLHQAIVNSCDVYFYQLGMLLKISGMSEWAKKLGTGLTTGIDLPQESQGLIPDDDWYRKRLGKNARTLGHSANMAIGQGEVLVTPLQMASLYAAVANDGIWCQPHLMIRVDDYQGQVVKQEKIIRRKLPLSSFTVQCLKEALYGVVNEPGGTGGASRIAGIDVCGKTGTAQNPHGNDHSWFVGFAPKDKPVIAVAVLVENAGHGSDVAAPMAGRIMQHYLELKGMMSGDVAAVKGGQ